MFIGVDTHDMAVKFPVIDRRHNIVNRSKHSTASSPFLSMKISVLQTKNTITLIFVFFFLIEI